MKRFKLQLAAVVLGVAFHFGANPSACIAAESVAGQWQQSDLIGYGQSKDACVWVSYVTRKFSIDVEPNGTLSGVYSNYEQAVWTLRSDASCTFGRPTMSNALFQRARLWPVRLSKVGERRWKVIATPANCTGDWCEDRDVWKQSFETEIKLEGSALVDSGAEFAGVKRELRYRPAREAVALANGAAAASSGLLQPLDSGECNVFFAQSLHPQSPLQGHLNDFCTMARQIRSMQQSSISGATVVNAVAIDRLVRPEGPIDNLDDVLVIGSVDFQDGSKAPRVLALRRHQGAWKLFAQFAQ